MTGQPLDRHSKRACSCGGPETCAIPDDCQREPFKGYRTIAADPPWEYPEGCVALGPGHGVLRASQPLPYGSMKLAEIKALPVGDLAARDCRLFLWTTNRWLPDAFDVLGAWGFAYKQALVWHKLDTNLPGSVAPNSAEFVLVGAKGKPARDRLLPSAVIPTTRSGGHSAKPECWLDYFEQVSPGPYLEMFARRARFGWDYWGDQSLGTVDLPHEGRCPLCGDFCEHAAGGCGPCADGVAA